ncbi:ACT domain-containing protein [Flavihumibacter fluvii]|uniref:ACT domain-containing protein n=1 Tax=Flavihumibacter fluvii TaxID=2838157 RepID=UPI001BDF486D|nr:ACT domain-containing protein [Flavihumibacter fluvii]ULQ53210.1 ACT domain-containing protein [Flavihumibacter fluvii]
MTGETNLKILLQTMKPILNPGDYVFCTRMDLADVNINDTVLIFKEEEGITIILKKEVADRAGFDYSFIASWITLDVHSSLDAVGLTAAFSKLLAENGISCNVVAAYYHDHIFVRKDHEKIAMQILNNVTG